MEQRPMTVEEALDTVTSMCEPLDQEDLLSIRSFDALLIRLYTNAMSARMKNALTPEIRAFIRNDVAEFRSQLGDPVDRAISFLDTAHVQTPQQSIIAIFSSHVRYYGHQLMQKLINNASPDHSLKPNDTITIQ